MNTQKNKQAMFQVFHKGVEICAFYEEKNDAIYIEMTAPANTADAEIVEAAVVAKNTAANHGYMGFMDERSHVMQGANKMPFPFDAMMKACQ